MSVEPQILLFFDRPWASDFFTLDDPVRGELDSIYGLSGDTPVDVSRYATTVTLARGRSNEFENMWSGRATITFNNHDRRFDPTYDAGPYTGSIGYLRDEDDLPVQDEADAYLFDEDYVLGESNITTGKRVEILSGSGQYRFVGTVDDWSLDYNVNGESVAICNVVDGLFSLSAADLDAWEPAAHTSGERVYAVLDRAQYPASREIADGLASLAGTPTGDVEAGTSVIEYLHLIADSEHGRFFDSASGVITFRDRHYAALNLSAGLVFSDSGGIPFGSVARSDGKELVRNSIQATRVGGSTETALEQSSIDKYGLSSLSYDNLLYDTDTQTGDLVEFLIGAYGQSRVRYTAITVYIHRLSDDERMAVLALDIGDPVVVSFTPNGIGDPVEQACVIEGVNEDFGQKTHTVTFLLSRLEQSSLFVLEDPTYGALDSVALLAF